MAHVGAIYTIDHFVRTPDQILDEIQRHEQAVDRPRPCHKHVWAEMTCLVEGETCNGRDTLFILRAARNETFPWQFDDVRYTHSR
jgi:hypothetical protein